MLKLRVTIMAIALATAGPGSTAFAIDVKPKSDTAQAETVSARPLPVKSFQIAPVKRESGLLDKLKRQLREVKPAAGQQQYDGFIDADSDGVDDRIAKKAKAQEQTERSKPATATPEPKTKSKRPPKTETPPR